MYEIYYYAIEMSNDLFVYQPIGKTISNFHLDFLNQD